MAIVRAIDLDGKEITIENPQRIEQPMGDIDHVYIRCGWSIFGLYQCEDCRATEGKWCGKLVVHHEVRTPPEPIDIDGRLVKEIIEIT